MMEEIRLGWLQPQPLLDLSCLRGPRETSSLTRGHPVTLLAMMLWRGLLLIKHPSAFPLNVSTDGDRCWNQLFD